MRCHYLILFFLISSGKGNETFEREVFEATTSIVRHFQNKNGNLDIIKELMPEKGDILVEHFRKFFMDKNPMLQETSRVGSKNLINSSRQTTFKIVFSSFWLKLSSLPQEIKDLTCSACIGGVSSLIFDYEVLGIGWEVIVQTLIGLCNVALDKDVCAGAIHNYAVLSLSLSERKIL